MRGLIMDRPLLISALLEYAADYHGEREIVSRTVEGPIHRYTYADAHRRAQQLAHALAGLGVAQGDRIATFAWNGYRHLEIYYAVSGMGAVCHTVNPRLFPDQLVYIVNHAEDSYVFLDLTFVPLVEQLADKLESVKGFIIMTDEAHMPETKLKGALCYETLITGEPETYEWPLLDEWTASSLCYTSGTTGNPKGALYCHRSTVLHSFACCTTDVMGLASTEVVLPVVPMFHANAWGIAYAAPMSGAKLVFPGAALDGASVHELLEQEGVTMTAGVPTVWFMLLDYMKKNDKRFSSLERVICGGSAMPRSMIEAFENDYGVRAIHAWGMTEMSPLGTIGALKAGMDTWPEAQRIDVQVKQGRALYGVEMKIVDDDGAEVARDGIAFGHLKVRGPWISSGYFKGAGGDILDEGGWFSTGDVATLDAAGYMHITDREKDVIKSGGEWISSIALENTAVAHTDVKEACVIGVAHRKWDERPLLLIVPAEGASPTKESLLGFLEGKIAKWWMPDDVLLVDELPHTATGKLLKAQLREEYGDYLLSREAG